MTKYNDKTRDYSIAYAKENLKRVPLDLPKQEYDDLKQAATVNGESVNGFIKTAIRERLAKLAGK